MTRRWLTCGAGRFVGSGEADGGRSGGHRPRRTPGLWTSPLAVLALGALLGACSSTPHRPTVPPNPYAVPQLRLGETASARDTLWTYAPVESGGDHPTTIDGFTVGVTPVTPDNAAFDSYRADVLVECRGPDDVPFYMSTVGFAVQLTLVNQTGHIIRTERSALQIEDGEGNAWPLIQGDWRDFVPRVVQGVQRRYQSYREALTAWQGDVRRQMDSFAWVPESYAQDYERFRAEAESCSGALVHSADCDSVGVASMAPAQLAAYFRQQAETQLQTAVAGTSARIDALQQQCQAAVEERAAAPGLHLVTEDTFERIRILPGQTFRAYVPLNADFGAAGPETVHLRLYDLVTQTDQAGTPTRRATFDFVLRRTAQRP